MKVPTSLLRQRITVEPFQGISGYGEPVYGTKVDDVPARVDGQRRVVRKADGTDLVASATILVRPDLNIPEQSRVTVPHPVTAGETIVYEVVEVLPQEGLTRPSHLEVLVS